MQTQLLAIAIVCYVSKKAKQKITVIMTTTNLCEKLSVTADYKLKEGQLKKNPI
jgi:DNA replication protein DnaC